MDESMKLDPDPPQYSDESSSEKNRDIEEASRLMRKHGVASLTIDSAAMEEMKVKASARAPRGRCRACGIFGLIDLAQPYASVTFADALRAQARESEYP